MRKEKVEIGNAPNAISTVGVTYVGTDKV